MKPIGTLLVGGVFAVVATLARSPTVQAGAPSDIHNDQSSIQSRIDQLAQPQPPAGGQPEAPPANAAPGSFPRSFLIPGTDTSIRIGGSVDATGTYYSR